MLMDWMPNLAGTVWLASTVWQSANTATFRPFEPASMDWTAESNTGQPVDMGKFVESQNPGRDLPITVESTHAILKPVGNQLEPVGSNKLVFLCCCKKFRIYAYPTRQITNQLINQPTKLPTNQLVCLAIL
jgi:hypothetical protein